MSDSIACFKFYLSVAKYSHCYETKAVLLIHLLLNRSKQMTTQHLNQSKSNEM